MVNTIVSGATLATKDTILGGLYIMDNRYDYEVTLTSSSKDNVDNVTKVFMGKVNKPKLTRIASCEQIEDNCTDNNGLFHRYLRVSYISPIYFNAFYEFIVSSEGDITNLSPNEEHMTHIENTTMRSE